MSSVPISQVPNVNKDVAKKFHSLRLNFLLAQIVIALLLAIAGWMLLWLALAAADYFLEIQFSWRQLALCSGIGAALTCVSLRLARHIRNSRARTFASRLELAFESFGQRIRTVLDTVDGRVSGPPEMLAALGHQTLGRWETLVPSQIIPKRLLAISGLFCAMTSAVALFSLLGQGEWKTAMLRTLGYEIPYTTLSVQPGNFKVLEGKEVAVSLTLIGRQNRDVQLRYKVVKKVNEKIESDKQTALNVAQDQSELDQSEWLTSDLDPRDSGDFGFEFGEVKDPIEYQFITSVGKTDIFRIEVQPLIEAVRTEIQTVPPSYTGLEPRTFTGFEATVLERSTVTVKVETNHPLNTVQLEFGARISKLAEASAVIEPSGNVITFELPTTESLHWRLNATGMDGTPMTTLKGRLRVREDLAPSIRWLDPQDEIRVHTLAELPMKAQVSDDYGVVETGIMFRVGDDEEFELTKKSMADLSSQIDKITTSVLLDEILPLESFSLTEKDYISYYAFAVDNREWGNQRVESDVRYIDIRPLRQFFSEIELPPGENGPTRLIVQLDEIIRRQRHLISRTRKMDKNGESQAIDDLKVIDRMVQAESELAGLTRFLAEFFVSQGNDDVAALNQAEASMLQASDSLSAVNLSLALTQEEDALRSLAEARRDLEIQLPKSTMAQQLQMAQVARQLQQKLRREMKQTEVQLADTLERIASEQMQLSEQMGRMSQGSTSQKNSNTSGQGTSQNALGKSGVGGAGESQDADSKDAQSASIQPSKSNELTAREQSEELFSRQVELLERVQAIEEQLSSRLEKSKLMSERLREVKADMDSLSKLARAGEQAPFQAGSRDVSDNLRELSAQLAALAASEAVNRVASLRDLTLSMAERERDLAEATQKLAQNSVGSPSQQSPQPGSGESTSQQPTGQPTGQSGKTQSDESNEASVDVQAQTRAARRLARRAQTIADVLATPSEVGDVAMSEVNDAIDKFVGSNEFTEKLGQSQSAAEQLSEGKAFGNEQSSEDQNKDTENDGGSTELDQALERARDYADAAMQLETLYRQLVSPRLARLRQIEQQASQLSQQLEGQGGEKAETSSMSTQGKMDQLQRNLRQEGMAGLAELLEPSGEEPGQSSQARYGLSRGSSVHNRVEVVVKELREHIQELILLEVAADRDAPVPETYRSAVDGYFRTIAGESEEK